jgi:hypothetical protein
MGTIYSIQAKVESLNQGNKFSLDVLAQNTYDNGQGYKLLPINLGSKGWIQNQYSLYKELPDEEIDRINRWLDTIANEQRSKTYDYNISLKTKKSILNYVDSRIEPFKKGDYVYLISCRNAQNEVLFYQCFTFTISDTNVWQLKHFTDNIINPLSSNKQVIMIHLKVPSEKTYKYIVKKYLDIDY